MTVEIRMASPSDVSGIYRLIQRYVELGRLLPRSIDDIDKQLSSFLVSEEGSNLSGCVSLEIFTNELGEVRSLAVDPTYSRLGHGRMLVDSVETKARILGLDRLIALTYVPEFFEKLGFKITDMKTLPEKVFGVCVVCPNFYNCDEIAMVKHLSLHNTKRLSSPTIIQPNK